MKPGEAYYGPIAPDILEQHLTARYELLRAHKLLYAEGLVCWSQGNISCRPPNMHGGIFIKASGVLYPDLEEKHMVRVWKDGTSTGEGFKPSTDTASHLYIYREMPDVCAIVHTHSTFATAFAAAGMTIPCCLTGMADEFGGYIPCAPYGSIGGEEIGKRVVDHIGRGGVVLIQNHGLFAVGANIPQAVKRAVMAEDCAKTTFYAMRLGPVLLNKEQVDDNYTRYHTSYGQRP